MPTAQKRTRQQRVAAVELPPGLWKKLWVQPAARRRAAAAGAVRRGGAVPVGVHARLGSAVQLPASATRAAPRSDGPRRLRAARPGRHDRDRARRAPRNAVAEYDQDPEPLVQLRGQAAHRNRQAAGRRDAGRGRPGGVGAVPAPAGRRHARPDAAGARGSSSSGSARRSPAENALEAFSRASWPRRWRRSSSRACSKTCRPSTTSWSQLEKIWVRSKKDGDAGSPGAAATRRCADHRRSRRPSCRKSLNEKLPSADMAAAGLRLAAAAACRRRSRSTSTPPATPRTKPARRSPDVTMPSREGRVRPGQGGRDDRRAKRSTLLQLEYEAEIAERTLAQRLGRSAAVLGMFVALYTLAGFYLYVRDRRVLDELLRLVDAAGPVRAHRHAGDDRQLVRLGRRRHSAPAVRA